MAVVLLWAHLCRRARQAFWLERFWLVTTSRQRAPFELLIRGGASGKIAAVVNALAKAGVELDGNVGVIPRPKGKPR
jgi:hypothetical protein